MGMKSVSVKCHGENSEGRRVFSCRLKAKEADILQQTHAEWATCSDASIEQCKTIVCAPFELSDKIDEIKGMACSDFLYIFNDNRNRHYFACVRGESRGQVLCYECEADMCFAAGAKFDMAVLMARDGFELPIEL